MVRRVSRPTWRRVLLAMALAGVLLAVKRAYAPAEEATFIWDDHTLAERDAPFRHAPLRALMTEPFWPDSPLADARANYYRPLVLLSLRWDAARGDGGAGTFHRTNVWLHLASCALLAAVAARLGARGEAAALAALVWGLAPRSSEAVAWISGRTDLLACAFGLAALLACPDAGLRRPARPTHGAALSAASGVLLFCALASKEVAVAFAGVLAVLIVGARGARVAGWAPRLLVNVAVPVGVYAALRGVALAGRGAPLRDLGAARRVASALEALGRYAEMALVDPLRPRTMIGMLGEIDVVRAAVGAVVLAAAIGAWALLRRRAPVGVRAGAALAALALVPVLHVVPFTTAGAVTADRLLYVPLAGLALGLAVTLGALGRRARVTAGAAAIAFGTLSFSATRARAADYQDEALFWVTAAERAHPSNTAPLRALAGIARDAGALDAACALYERAATVLARGDLAGLAPHRRTRENLVGCLAKRGQREDALRLARDLAAAHPESGRVQMALGFAHLHALDFDGAERALTRAAGLDPRLAGLVRPALDDLPSLRSEARLFGAPAAREADPLAFAAYLGRVGHLAEAEEAYDVVASRAADPRARAVAVQFLVTHGQPAAARRALEANPTIPAPERTRLGRTLAEREDRSARVVAVLPRIHALVEE